jgi:hypothetical protein
MGSGKQKRVKLLEEWKQNPLGGLKMAKIVASFFISNNRMAKNSLQNERKSTRGCGGPGEVKGNVNNLRRKARLECHSESSRLVGRTRNLAPRQKKDRLFGETGPPALLCQMLRPDASGLSMTGCAQGP